MFKFASTTLLYVGMNLDTYIRCPWGLVRAYSLLQVTPRSLVDDAILKLNAGSSTTSTFVYQTTRATSPKLVTFTVTTTIISNPTHYCQQLSAVMRNGSVPLGLL